MTWQTIHGSVANDCRVTVLAMSIPTFSSSEQTPAQCAVLANAKRIVVKVGSSLVTNEGRGLDANAIEQWSRQLAALVADGREVIMVSSGAIAEGMKRLGWPTRPKHINELQAAAAVGQMGLIHMYESKLRAFGVGSAQVLLTHGDLADRERYLNARRAQKLKHCMQVSTRLKPASSKRCRCCSNVLGTKTFSKAARF